MVGAVSRSPSRKLSLGPELSRSRFLGRLFGSARRELEERARALLDQVGLADAADKYPVQLSGGMQQRLAIAQALIMEPKVLLLDEPFGALDQSTKKSMHRLILDLWRTNGMIIVMVTHDIQEAFTLGTRVLMIDKRRRDPMAPEAYGSTITQHLELDPARKPDLDLGAGDEHRSMASIFESLADRMAGAVSADHGEAQRLPAADPDPTPDPVLRRAGE